MNKNVVRDFPTYHVVEDSSFERFFHICEVFLFVSKEALVFQHSQCFLLDNQHSLGWHLEWF